MLKKKIVLKKKPASNRALAKNKKLTVSDLIKDCHTVAKTKGWWDTHRNDGELIALMHSELSEALEAMRSNDDMQENLAEELADCCIRIFDYCGSREIDLETAILKKIEYNKTRPYRHGKKF
jgi:NTP pyrophosphatase (non-canonical NTP hydrolase)